MPREESRYPDDWFRVGRKELRRAEHLLEINDLDGAAFNLQQAAEKFFKGYLLSKGWELRRIHDLEPLLNEALRYDSGLEEFRAGCLKLTDYYIEERYPFVGESGLKRNEVEESFTMVKRLIAKIAGNKKET